MVYFTGDRLRVSFVYSSWRSWQTSPMQVFITIIISLMACVFVRRPPAVQVKGMVARRILVILNIVASIIIIAIVFYKVRDLRDGITRATGASNSVVMTLTVSTVAIMSVHFLLLMYADTKLPVMSPSRDAAVRIFFSSMQCIVFIIHFCGATERDWQVCSHIAIYSLITYSFLCLLQSIVSAGASLLWLYVIPRNVTTIFITYGAVWPFLCGVMLLGPLYPFVVFVGLQTASDGILGIMDTAILPTVLVFAYLVSLLGIYSSIKTSIEILDKELKNSQ